jgi:hypothetical protein
MIYDMQALRTVASCTTKALLQIEGRKPDGLDGLGKPHSWLPKDTSTVWTPTQDLIERIADGGDFAPVQVSQESLDRAERIKKAWDADWGTGNTITAELGKFPIRETVRYALDTKPKIFINIMQYGDINPWHLNQWDYNGTPELYSWLMRKIVTVPVVDIRISIISPLDSFEIPLHEPCLDHHCIRADCDRLHIQKRERVIALSIDRVDRWGAQTLTMLKAYQNMKKSKKTEEAPREGSFTGVCYTCDYRDWCADKHLKGDYDETI